MTDLDNAFIANQFARMSGLAGYLDMPAYSELAAALRNHTNSEQHAKDTITAWIETREHKPKPCELIRLARELSTEYSSEPTADVCDKCYSTGWARVFYHQKWDDHRRLKATKLLTDAEAEELRKKIADSDTETVAEGSKPCTCNIGRRISDAQNRAASTRGKPRRRSSAGLEHGGTAVANFKLF